MCVEVTGAYVHTIRILSIDTIARRESPGRKEELNSADNAEKRENGTFSGGGGGY